MRSELWCGKQREHGKPDMTEDELHVYPEVHQHAKNPLRRPQLWMMTLCILWSIARVAVTLAMKLMYLVQHLR
jgi:hypothetical protein